MKRVRASVNLPADSPNGQPFTVGQVRYVDERDPHLAALIRAGYLVDLPEGTPTPPPREARMGVSDSPMQVRPRKRRGGGKG